MFVDASLSSPRCHFILVFRVILLFETAIVVSSLRGFLCMFQFESERSLHCLSLLSHLFKLSFSLLSILTLSPSLLPRRQTDRARLERFSALAAGYLEQGRRLTDAKHVGVFTFLRFSFDV